MSTLPHALRRAFFVCWALSSYCLAGATGLKPDSTIVQLSASDGQAQMAVTNTETSPMLMNVVVMDLPGSEALTVMPLPSVARVEGNGRQIVRFVLAESAADIKKQYLKRVSFEGIPPRSGGSTEAVLAVNVRQIIPMVISPPGLVQAAEPWTQLAIVRKNENEMELRNDSPFVVRLRTQAELLPMNASVQLLVDTYVLPGEHIAFELPKDVVASAVMAVRISPASPWGYTVDPYEIHVAGNETR